MTVKAVRAANLKRLIVERAGGSQRLFAETYGFSKAHLSQMVTFHRDMGDKVARKIEQALKLPPGYMDRGQSDQIAEDWEILAEPLKTQWFEAIRAAAENIRQSAKIAPPAKAAPTKAPANKTKHAKQH